MLPHLFTLPTNFPGDKFKTKQEKPNFVKIKKRKQRVDSTQRGGDTLWIQFSANFDHLTWPQDPDHGTNQFYFDFFFSIYV